MLLFGIRANSQHERNEWLGLAEGERTSDGDTSGASGRAQAGEEVRRGERNVKI
jgi:hypothetical protein